MGLNIHYYNSREAPFICSFLNGTEVWGLEQHLSIRTVSGIYVQNSYQITVPKKHQGCVLYMLRWHLNKIIDSENFAVDIFSSLSFVIVTLLLSAVANYQVST